MSSRRTRWISAFYYPFFVGVVCFLFMLYKFFPPLSLLPNYFPLIICTILFLGILLRYSKSNAPKNKEDDNTTHKSSSLKLKPVATDYKSSSLKIKPVAEDYSFRSSSLKVNDYRSSSLKINSVAYDYSCRSSSLKIKSFANDLGARNEDSFKFRSHVGSRRINKGMTVRTIASGNRRYNAASKAIEENEVNQAGDMSVASNSSVDEDGNNKSLVEDREQSTEKLAKDSLNKGQDIGGATISGENNITVLDEDADKTKVDDGCDSCLGSPWYHVNHQDASLDSEPEGAQSSNPSVANVTPVLDELDPLVSKHNSEDGSVALSQNHDGSVEEEAENHEDEDEQAQEDKDVVNKVAVKWTVDDQRNLMDLGDSELERNRRLENLIAKRRARKAMEKNLIDLDDNMETPESHGQLPSISAPRWNPFDLPYDFDESVPGSAPSILVPRRNLFDLSLDQVNDEEKLGHDEYVTVPQRDILFRRHESFTIGAPFYVDLRQERHSSRFKFYFGEEKIELEDTVYTDLHGQVTEANDSKVNSTSESGTFSSITNKEHQKDFHQGSISPVGRNAESAKHDSQSSDDAKSMDSEQVERQMNRNNILRTHLSMKHTHQTTKNFGEVEDATSEESVSSSPISYAGRVEVIDEEYEFNSSIPSEAEKSSPKMRTHEQRDGLEQIHGGTYGGSSISMKSIAIDSNVMNEEAGQIHDRHVMKLVYDSSPTASIKSHSNSKLDEASIIADKGDSTCNQSLASDINENLSGEGSPLNTVERNILSEEETEESSSLLSEVGSPLKRDEGISREETEEGSSLISAARSPVRTTETNILSGGAIEENSCLLPGGGSPPKTAERNILLSGEIEESSSLLSRAGSPIKTFERIILSSGETKESSSLPLVVVSPSKMAERNSLASEKTEEPSTLVSGARLPPRIVEGTILLGEKTEESSSLLSGERLPSKTTETNILSGEETEESSSLLPGVGSPLKTIESNILSGGSNEESSSLIPGAVLPPKMDERNILSSGETDEASSLLLRVISPSTTTEGNILLGEEIEENSSILSGTGSPSKPVETNILLGGKTEESSSLLSGVGSPLKTTKTSILSGGENEESPCFLSGVVSPQKITERNILLDGETKENSSTLPEIGSPSKIAEQNILASGETAENSSVLSRVESPLKIAERNILPGGETEESSRSLSTMLSPLKMTEININISSGEIEEGSNILSGAKSPLKTAKGYILFDGEIEESLGLLSGAGSPSKTAKPNILSGRETKESSSTLLGIRQPSQIAEGNISLGGKIEENSSLQSRAGSPSKISETKFFSSRETEESSSPLPEAGSPLKTPKSKILLGEETTESSNLLSSKTTERNILSDGEIGESLSVALAEKNEPLSRGIPVNKEFNDTGDELSRVHEDSNSPKLPISLEAEARQMLHSDLSFVEIELSKDS